MIRRNGHIMLLILAFLTTTGELYGQWKEVDKNHIKKVMQEIDRATEKYPSYSYKTQYRFYDQLDDKTPKASYKGYVRSENRKHYEIRMIDQLLVQNEQLKVIIDSVGRHVVIDKPDSILNYQKTALDYENMMQNTTKVYEQKSKTGTKYSLEFPEGQKYKSIEISLNTKGQISHYIMYAGQQIPGNKWDERPTLQPRMEIDYSEYNLGTSGKAKMKQVSEIVEEKEGKLYLTAAYTGYTLVDLRIKNEQK